MTDQEQVTQTSPALQKVQTTSLIPQGTFYMPGVGKYGPHCKAPGAKLMGYAAALVEIVLLLNPRAQEPYRRLLNACKEPEVQSLWQEYMSHFLNDVEGNTQQIVGAIKSVLEGEEVDITQLQHPKEMPPILIDALNRFVIEGFNRAADIRNESYKVMLNINFPLYAATLLKAFAEAIDIDIAGNDKTNPHSLLYLYGSKPKTRADRRRKTKFIDKFHTHGFGAVNKETLLHGAVLWYKSRISPGKLVEVCNEYQLANQASLSRALEPYDDAAGYPRHPE